MKKHGIIYFLVFLTGAGLVSGCANSASSASTTTNDIGQVTEITLTNTVEASGSVTPRQIATVNWTLSGTIATVPVVVGQQVARGDILMTLDTSSLPESLKKAQEQLAEFTSPSALAAAQQKVLEAQSAYDTAVQNRKYLDYQDEDVIENAHAEYILAKAKYDDAYENYQNWEDEDYSDHYDTDLATAYTALYQAKTEMETAEYLYDLYKSQSSAQTYSEYDNAVLVTGSALTEAQNYLTLISGGDIPDDATSASIQTYRQALETLDGINLRAPFDGSVAAIYDEPGILVSNNHTSVKLIDRSALYVGISLEESEVTQVSVGLPATVTVDILPELPLSGHIWSIDPVGTVSNGMVYYEVEVELDKTNDAIPINASASVSIQIGEPETKLLVPASAVQSDDAGEFVQVIRNGSYERVDVVSGTILSDDTVVVSGDLTVGDFVLLIIEVSSTEESSGAGLGILGGGGNRGEIPSGGGEMPQGGQQPPSGSAPQNP